MKLEITVNQKRAGVRICAAIRSAGKNVNMVEGTTELRPFYILTAEITKAEFEAIKPMLPKYARHELNSMAVSVIA